MLSHSIVFVDNQKLLARNLSIRGNRSKRGDHGVRTPLEFFNNILFFVYYRM